MDREKQENNNRLVEWTKKKEGMRLKIVIPQANTHSNVAKEQYLVPRIYMKQWSYNDSNSVYIYEKAKPADGVHSASVYSINYIIGYNDIKAGDIFTIRSIFCLFKKSD